MSADLDPALLARPLEGLSVLAVDDDEDARTLLSLLLTMHGASVMVADSAPAALEALGVTRPDVLVSDLSMPGEDGFSLIRKVRALGAAYGGAVPAVAVTGLASPEHRARALAAGFEEHLAKPVAIEELIGVIERLTNRR